MTEQVWEETETAEHNVTLAATTKSAVAAKPHAAATPKAAPKQGEKKQSSLMSFFKK